MNILFSPIVDYPKVEAELGIDHCGDYVVDCLFHGFRKSYGSSCVDFTKNPLMYKGQDHGDKFVHKGFSMFGLIDDEPIDREDINTKVVNKFFDYIICPIHHTNRNNQKEIDKKLYYLSRYYPANKIAVICSDENPGSNSFMLNENRCTFFKQEFLPNMVGRAHPIAYSIPREKIVEEIPEKDTDFAPLMPSFLNRNHPHEKTYIYQDEKSYYDQYKRSYFGFTCKKGGWDCMRHYEILACGCVPFFTDIEGCPKDTLHGYPKKLVRMAKSLTGVHPSINKDTNFPADTFLGTVMDNINTTGSYINHDKFNLGRYQYIASALLKYTKKNLTTEARAKYIIETLEKQ